MVPRIAKVLPVTLLWCACVVISVDAQSTARPVSTNVRSANSRLAGALFDGIRKSQTLRSLVAALDESARPYARAIATKVGDGGRHEKERS